jgi:hypothetical protein
LWFVSSSVLEFYDTVFILSLPSGPLKLLLYFWVSVFFFFSILGIEPSNAA